MLLSALLHDAKIEYSGADFEIKSITSDSRKANGDALFVCITGFASDGHAYAKSAYDKGCRAFVAEKELELPHDAVVIMQKNTRVSLALISAAFYGFPSRRLKVVGITGTKGKTTTALMCESIANKNGISAGYIGSNGVSFAGRHYETQNTTPESIELHRLFSEMVSAGVEAVFLEVSSQALYLDRVCGIDFFATAFTNLAPDHIGGVEHPTFEHYRDSKKKLFCDYASVYTVYNAEDGASEYMMQGAKAQKTSFGLSHGDCCASDIRPFMADGVLGIEFLASTFGESERVKLPMPGKFSASNAMCAISLCQKLGISLKNAAKALGETFAAGRFEIVKTKLDAVFVIDYAHNGFSLTSALETLRGYSPRTLWCVVGSVGGRTKGRRSELGEAASRLCDRVVLTADNSDKEDTSAICREMHDAFVRDVPCEIIEDRDKAIEYVIRNVKSGDIVLLAGKGHENYQLVNGEKIPFSERKIIEKYALEMSAELV